jgi:6-phosphogluconolactonase
MWNNTLHIWHDLPDATSLASALSQAMQHNVVQALSVQSSVLIGLAGGSTPMAAYSDFAQAKLPWQQLQFVLIDERFVPTTDPQSNEGNISKAFTPVKDQLGAWLGLFHFADTIEQAAAFSNAEVKKLNAALDIVVIGMGTDGHIASLFVESADYSSAMDVNSTQAVLPIRFDQVEKKIDRLSFTLAELLKAKKMLICITGSEKRSVLESSLNGNKPEYAVAQLLKYYTNPVEIFWSPA